jgi:hypothetical protein
MKWTRHSGKWTYLSLGWQATRIVVSLVPSPHMVGIGPAGIVSVSSPQGDVEEEVDPSDDGPRRRGDIRDLRVIGGRVYAAGMSRQVYRREASGQWSRQDGGVVTPKGTMGVSGFNAIDGLEETDIYAVGFNGEIWRRTNQIWSQIESPSNLVLHRVCFVRPDLIYACGQQGVLLRGNGNAWAAIQHDTTRDDFWGMEWYRNRLYLACDSGLYVLSDSGTLEPVDTHAELAPTVRHLHAADGVLCSSGPKHVLWTEDGVKWHDITP